MSLDEIARAVRPGDLFRVTQTHWRPNVFTTLNKGAIALIVSCDDKFVEALVTDDEGSDNLRLNVSQITLSLQMPTGGLWEALGEV